MKNGIMFFVSCFFVTAFCTAQAQSPSGAYRQEGIASWYGAEFEGRPTASGELFNPELFTAAHPDLPFGTMLVVTNVLNGEQVLVRVNDRGPFVKSRIIDVSKAAAEKLNMLETGTAQVVVELAPRNFSTSNTQPAGSPSLTQAGPDVVSPVAEVSSAGTPSASDSFAANRASPNRDTGGMPPNNASSAPLSSNIEPREPVNRPALTAPPQSVNQAATPTTIAPPQTRTSTVPQPAARTSTPSAPANVPAQSASSGSVTPPPYTPQQPIISQHPVTGSQPSNATTTGQIPPPPSRSQGVAPPVASFQPVPTVARPPAPSAAPPVMPNSAIAQAIPAVPVQTQSARSYPSYPSAEIKGGPFINGRYYRIQIGSFKVAKNAVEVFDRLSAAGLSPQWEPFGDMYRVVISNIRAEEISGIALKLGSAGFKDAIAREER